MKKLLKLITTPPVRAAKRGRPTLKEAAVHKKLEPKMKPIKAKAILKAAKEAAPAKRKARVLRPLNVGMGHPKGERHHNAKLSDKDRKKIITTWNKGAVSQGMLARQYKVNQSTIRNVLMNNQWVLA